MAKRKKVRVELRKNRAKPPRERGWTGEFKKENLNEDQMRSNERVRAGRWAAPASIVRRRPLAAWLAAEPGSHDTTSSTATRPTIRCDRSHPVPGPSADAEPRTWTCSPASRCCIWAPAAP